MDIERPPIEGQVEPAPWLVARGRVNVPGLVDGILQDDPDASVQQVLHLLARRNVQANGALVAQRVLDFRRRRRAESEVPSVVTRGSRGTSRIAAPAGIA
jgi:hypothetical protein